MQTPDQPTLARIDTAFDQLNSLLDARGVLDDERTLRAAAQLRLEIARAMGQSDRVCAAEVTLQELNPILQGFDLRTFFGWTSAALALLKGSAPGTALWDEAYDGYLLAEDGILVAIAASDVKNGQIRALDGQYDDAHQVDASAWDSGRETWDGCSDPSLGRDALLNPKLVTLEIIPADRVGSPTSNV